ncbi:hypothetical protein AGOR_G00172140 [Albula goreensis]|uniref:Uncharacterized protein n=1 Tax=Albula goreensis TaxID=1534307 RepID=A0A8T3CYF1_9TELE|nr:hypothetical protein AGOR_G00172140 [Albula goreensis]
MTTFYEVKGNHEETEQFECQVQLKAEQSDSEHVEFPNHRLDEAAWASLFDEEEEFTSHVAKEKEEEVEVQICPPFEMTEDLKEEVKHEELQVSQNCKGLNRRKVKTEDRMSGTMPQSLNSPQQKTTQRPYTCSQNGKNVGPSQKLRRCHRRARCGRLRHMVRWYKRTS